ncbi:MAG: hypothetical protein H0V97_09895 [Actinobacteria bacterium]|nr:hypothetical protein [Actinomycetota bacterium]
MSSANGGYLQGFTGQALATEDQITIACTVTNESTDFKQLKPMIEQAADNLKSVGVSEAIGIVTADSGYLSDDNLTLEEELEVELLIATKSRKRAGTTGERPRGRIPNDLSRTQLMERKAPDRARGAPLPQTSGDDRAGLSDNSDNVAWDASAGADSRPATASGVSSTRSTTCSR